MKPKRKSIGATPSVVPHEVLDKKKRYFEEESPAGMHNFLCKSLRYD